MATSPTQQEVEFAAGEGRYVQSGGTRFFLPEGVEVRRSRDAKGNINAGRTLVFDGRSVTTYGDFKTALQQGGYTGSLTPDPSVQINPRTIERNVEARRDYNAKTSKKKTPILIQKSGPNYRNPIDLRGQTRSGDVITVGQGSARIERITTEIVPSPTTRREFQESIFERQEALRSQQKEQLSPKLSDSSGFISEFKPSKSQRIRTQMSIASKEEGTFKGMLAGSALFAAGYAKGAVKGLTAPLRPKFYTEEIPQTFGVVKSIFKGELFPEAAKTIITEPYKLGEPLGYLKGTQTLGRGVSKVRQSVATRSKVSGGVRTFDVAVKVPKSKGVSTYKFTTPKGGFNLRVAVASEQAVLRARQSFAGGSPLAEAKAYNALRLREAGRSAQSQTITEIIKGDIKLTATARSNVRKAVRKSYVAKNSIAPLDTKPKGTFAQTLPVYEPSSVKLLRLREAYREQITQEAKTGQRSLLSVPANIRKSIRKQYASIARTPFILKGKKFPKYDVANLEKLAKPKEKSKGKTKPFAYLKVNKQTVTVKTQSAPKEIKTSTGSQKLILKPPKVEQVQKSLTTQKVAQKSLVGQRSKTATKQSSKATPSLGLIFGRLPNTSAYAQGYFSATKQVSALATRSRTALRQRYDSTQVISTIQGSRSRVDSRTALSTFSSSRSKSKSSGVPKIKGFAINLKKSAKIKSGSKKVRLKSSFNPKYVASLEASVFKVRGRKPSKFSIGTGLQIRPVLR